MDYALKAAEAGDKQKTLGSAWRALKPLLAGEQTNIAIAVACVIVSAGSSLLGPAITARIVDTAIKHGDYGLLLRYVAALATVYVVALGTSYLQVLRMGTVGRNVLFKLRTRLFTRLSALPIAFFSQNRAGDLISRVNSDADKINPVLLSGADADVRRCIPDHRRGHPAAHLELEDGPGRPGPGGRHVYHHPAGLAVGEARQPQGAWKVWRALSGDVSESLANFQVIVAFNRVDYFREKFDTANQPGVRASVKAGIASGVFMPLYTLGGSTASILVLGLGVSLILHGQLTVGLLIGYLLYVTAFYNPLLAWLATVWSSLQTMMAAMDQGYRRCCSSRGQPGAAAGRRR